MVPIANGAIADYEGSYEALLISGEGESALPAAKLELKVSKTGGFTGKLASSDPKIYSLKGSLKEEGDVAVIVPAKNSTENSVQISRGPGLTPYTLSFTLNGGVLSASLSGGVTASADAGVALRTFGKGVTPSWMGSYSFALSSPVKAPEASDTDHPTGSGYASATVDAKGVFKFKGKLADGTAFTGALAPGAETISYRHFINPYKGAPGSFVGGGFELQPTEGDAFVVAADTEFFWKNAGEAKPKPNTAYAAGFGPLGVAVKVATWRKPGKNETLVSLLGMGGKQIPFSLTTSEDAGLDLTSYYGQVPHALEINAKNELIPVFGDIYAPGDAASWAKIWKVKVNPATGVYTGTLTLNHLVLTEPTPTGEKEPPIYTPAKLVKRKVTVEGVLVPNPGDAGAPFSAEGFILVSALNSKTQPVVSGGAVGQGPLEDRGTGNPSSSGLVTAGTAGIYSSVITNVVALDLTELPSSGGFEFSRKGEPKGIPANGNTVSLTVAPDMSHIVYNGRRLPLVGDSRPVALVFSDASKKTVKNNLTVTLRLNNEGKVIHTEASYFQLLAGALKYPTMTVELPGGKKQTVKGSTVSVPVPIFTTVISGEGFVTKVK